MEVSSSLLNVNKEDAIHKFYTLEKAHTDYFHIDVMDGEFVENNTVELMKFYADTLKGITGIPLDIHLMCKDVKKYIDEFAACEPRIINFHIEAIKESVVSSNNSKNNSNAQLEADNKKEIVNKEINSNELKEKISAETKKMINYVKDQNSMVGIAVNPETDISEIYEFLPYIHNVLVMSVHPGKGGQKFIKETIEKIKTLKNYITENNLENQIEVDGGINFETAKEVFDAGADIATVGSFLINSKDYDYTIEKFHEI